MNTMMLGLNDWIYLMINALLMFCLVIYLLPLDIYVLDEWYGFYAMDECGTYAMFWMLDAC